MAEEKKNVITVSIGGKGSSLSSSSVFLIASGLAHLRIDSSILDKLDANPNQTTPTSTSTSTSTSSINYQIPLPEFLTLEERRASLTLLLSKLLLLASPLRPDLPLFILNSLNNNNSPSSSSSSHILLTQQDRSLLDASLPTCILDGIASLLDHQSSSLSPLSEAVSALSCEASSASLSSFNLVDSGDGKCLKDEASVASDIKVLLNGSKFTGKLHVEPVSLIPQLFGCFRESLRSLHSRARVALNSPLKSSGTAAAGKAWETSLAPLASVLRNLGDASLSRAHLVVASLASDSLRSSLTHLLEKQCPTKENLRDAFKLASEAALAEEYVHFAHNVNRLFALVRCVVSWEMLAAFLSLEGSELLPTNQKVTVSADNNKAEKKSDKRKKVLGKGTSVVIQLIKDALHSSFQDAVDELAVLQKAAQELYSLLDPKAPASVDFAEKIKVLVESNETRRLPKLPKGTRDFAKEQMTVREKAFSIITEVFKRHGAMALDTPVFELRETLMGKYGEDSKLIYDLADQGGELCSLRYDLTVPFARYVAMNSLTSFKRYQIAKVYRRDNPSKGRYREFYQCDLDIAGQYEKMGPDFEVVKILTELLDGLDIGDYEVKLNHRKLLDGMLDLCGVPPEKFRTICSSIDKLDKQSFDQVKREMVEEKGLSSETADRIGTFVKERGSPLELLSKLKQEGSEFLKHEGSALALDELEILFKALKKSNCVDKVVFDLSLARGLEYYTGVIFEAVFKGTTQVGSIAAGGRYDNLIGMFGSKQVPAVGVSLGIERVFAIMEQNQKDQNQVIRANETQVLVGVMGDDLSLAAELVSELWSAKIKAEYTMVKKVVKIFERAEGSGIPYAVMVGERELNAGIVKVRDVKAKTEDPVPRDRMVEELLNRLRNSS